MGSTSKEILRGLAAMIQSFVPTYQRGQAMQMQQGRQRQADERYARQEDRAQRYERRAAERHPLEQQRRKEGLGGGPTKGGLETAGAFKDQYGGWDPALAAIDEELRGLDEFDKSIKDPDPNDYNDPDLIEPDDLAKAQRAAFNAKRSIQTQKNALWKRKRLLERAKQRELSAQQDPMPTQGVPGQPPGPDASQDIQQQRQMADAQAESARGFPDHGPQDQHEEQRKINFTKAFQDIKNPNIPPAQKLQAWMILAAFGVPVPPQIQALIDQGQPPGPGMQRELPGGSPQSLADQLQGSTR